MNTEFEDEHHTRIRDSFRFHIQVVDTLYNETKIKTCSSTGFKRFCNGAFSFDTLIEAFLSIINGNTLYMYMQANTR